jgi:hypothetical protein
VRSLILECIAEEYRSVGAQGSESDPIANPFSSGMVATILDFLSFFPEYKCEVEK